MDQGWSTVPRQSSSGVNTAPELTMAGSEATSCSAGGTGQAREMSPGAAPHRKTHFSSPLSVVFRQAQKCHYKNISSCRIKHSNGRK